MSLFEDVVFYLGRRRAVARLRADSKGDDDETIRVGVVLSLPVVIGNLRRWSERDEQAEWLAEVVATVPPALATDIEALLATESLSQTSNDLLDLVLGEDAPRIVRRLADRARVVDETAARLLSITTSAVLAHLASRHGSDPSSGDLRVDFAEEERSLASGGWQPWVDETLAAPGTLVPLDDWQRERRTRDLVNPAPSLAAGSARPESAVGSNAPAAPAIDPDGPGRRSAAGDVEPPAWRNGSASDDVYGRPGDNGAEAFGGPFGAPPAYPPPQPTGRVPRVNVDDTVALARRPRHREASFDTASGLDHPAADPEWRPPRQAGGPAPARRPSTDPDWDDNDSWVGQPRVLLIGAALLVVAALLAFAFFRGGDDPGSDVAADGAGSPAADPGDDPADGSATSTADDGATPSTTGATGETPATALERQTVEVALEDPLGITEGTGTARFDLDPVSGEVCYEFVVVGVTSPYDGHIHVGPAGVKGGIVVDFGLLEGDSSGCIANSPAGTQAILADLSGHYAEFHDADGVATVRAQLAQPESVGITTADPTADDTGGAFARIEPGRLVLTGEVPDQVTIDKYLETFADLDPDDIEVVNELTIVPGAPRPSGRIVVDDTVFFEFDSAELVDPEGTVLEDLATLFTARPAWRMRVVGHTDDLGTEVYNLELSLQRATAVRDALVAAGVDADALTVEGAGDTNPIAPNDSEENRSRNRRIEIEVIPG